MSFSLYIHIPWCQVKCPYCDFNSWAAASWPEDDYVRALLAEFSHRVAQQPWLNQGIATIFFGGGTPSLFSPKSIGTILDTVSNLCPLEPEVEITLEGNPGTINAEKLCGFRAAGVNRLSFGAQSFDPQILKFLGRIHGPDETRAAAGFAHRAGFDRLNFDLIFAVPGQTVAGILRDITAAAALGPDHISAYNLTFEEGTRFYSDRKHGLIRELDSELQAEMFSAVRNELPRRGYRMYEISNYAIPGHEARHNLAYWRGDSYLGIGAGAHSFARDGVAGRRWWNHKNPAIYVDRALESGIAESGSERSDERTARGEFVFCNLRLTEGLQLERFRDCFGVTFDEAFGERSRSLLETGLLVRSNGNLRLSDRGLELADSVFAEFVSD